MNTAELAARRTRLRAITAQLRELEQTRSSLRADQLQLIRDAIGAGATIHTDVVAASGVSRAYLHKEGVRPPAVKANRPEQAKELLSRISTLRDEIAQLEAKSISTALQERNELIRELRPHMLQKDLAADAQVSPEWIRLLGKSARKA